MQGYRDATIRTNDDGSLVVLWVDGLHCEEIILPAMVLAGMGLFDEGRPGWDSYEQESQDAAELLEMKLRIDGFAVEPSFNLTAPVAEVCCPGPPLRKQPVVRIAKIQD